MSEQEKFLARLDGARKRGLTDVKFFFHPSRAVKPEQIFAGLNAIEEAIDQGRVKQHRTWAGDEVPA